MEPVSTISAALSAARSTLDLAKSAIAARDDAKLAEVLKALNDEIIGAQNTSRDLLGQMRAADEQINSLMDRERELHKELTELKTRATERTKYRHHEMSPGVFVLARNAETLDGGTVDPAHYLCQPCMDNESKKVVLQREPKSGHQYLHCNACNARYFTGEITQDAPLNYPKLSIY